MAPSTMGGLRVDGFGSEGGNRSRVNLPSRG
ncbi:hypothetical protein SAMN03159362_0791 [Pseudomonas sp. NFIX51]|nr:hypothetical protein SAMN03159362_0791 [Pseudomonas sp. NFIX51]